MDHKPFSLSLIVSHFSIPNLAFSLLYHLPAMTFAPSQLLGSAILGYLTTLSLIFVGYLAVLEYREFRRNRRLDAQRKRLGLRHA
jgi:hypothetical protein